MKKLLALLCLVAALPAYAIDCGNMGEWLGSGCQRIADTYEQGSPDLYLSGYAWHDPNTYTDEKLDELNSKAWGLGFGKHVTDADGNQDIVYGMIFSDSHKDPQINVGYGRIWYWNVVGPMSAGLGYTVGLVSRQDIYGGIPFPIALPLVSIKADRVSLMGTFIPKLGGGLNHGNVAFFFGRVELQ
ncbi:Lipid A palmitoyltransferase PagP [Andreprevotia sp. IGB-42]|uniref:peptide ABC transporter permease n=1 Tax=Andreprevotia sp. IGB-42 TaxID=2497473 RepID=UPI001356AECD|nr:peptide ABC transporter permease [Andreprevotia sp. IGB-42]KAF0813799.1 Lipid A palmitoyltransferase PagP [Andreprevotia sp. IGB-42]